MGAYMVRIETLQAYIRESKFKLQRIIGEAQSAFEDLKQLEKALETVHEKTLK